MNTTKVVSAVGLSVLVVAAILAVSAHAAKPPLPPGPPKPVVITVSGAISGIGTDAANMAIEFSGLNMVVNGLYVANPDFSLSVSGTGRGERTLSYYYCDHEGHAGSVEVCAESEHDPANYRRLIIKNGALEGKGETLRIVFAEGSPWEIWRKAQGSDPAEGARIAIGNLGEDVIYKETQEE